MFISIESEHTSELVVKKSKFIANIYYVENKEETENKIKELKKKYHDARHNCIAYRIIEDGNILEKFSDDGEPSGTAGAPMLNILKKNNLCNILVVVTRYFGGILLGTGGLVRAYSDVTINAIDESSKVNICIGREFEIKLDYSNMENFKYYCRKNLINITNIQYENEIVCLLELEDVSSFIKDIEKRKVNILEYKELGKKYIRKNII